MKQTFRRAALIKNPIMQCQLCFARELLFLKKNPCIVARIVSFDTAGLHLLTFRILELYPSKDSKLDLSHAISL